MKDKIIIAIAIILVVVISFGAGYFSNSGKYDVVDKQDKLAVMYNDTQAKVNEIIVSTKDLSVKYETMKELETLTDAEVELMEAIPAQITKSNKLMSSSSLSMKLRHLLN